MRQAAALVLLLLLRAGTAQDPPGAIRVLSPVSDQQLARGQDLVVKFALGDDGRPCRVVVVVNGRVLTTHDGCTGSVNVPEHELSPGANSLELFRQGDDQEQEAAVTFQVVDPLPWPLPPGTDAREGTSTEETCWSLTHQVLFIVDFR